MRTLRAGRRGYAGAAAVCVMLTNGCGGGADPTRASQGPVLPSPASAVATPAATSSTATTNPTVGLPMTARERSFAGAEAFVRHFVDEFVEGAVNSRAHVLDNLITRDCIACQRMEARLRGNAEKGARFEQKPVRILSLTPMSGAAESSDTFRILGRIEEYPNRILSADRTTIKTIQGTTTQSIFELRWSGSSWLVQEVRNPQLGKTRD